MTETDATLEGEVRRAAPDLWLSTRLIADPAARGRVIALYALHGELAKVAAAAKIPLAGEIRLAWWRDEVEALSARGLAAGRSAPGHPALKALAGAPGLDATILQTMIEARHAELEPRPFADEATLLAYLDGVDGAVMRAAAGLLAPGIEPPLVQAGRAWGWSRLMRERAAWKARGRDWTPTAWGDPSDAEIAAHVRHRVRDALALAKEEARALPVQAFPAVAYATLTRGYAEGRRFSDLEKRTRLLWASVRGWV